MITIINPAPFLDGVTFLAPGWSPLRRRMASFQMAQAKTYAYVAADNPADLLMLLGFYPVLTAAGDPGQDEVFFHCSGALARPEVARRYGPALMRAARLTLRARVQDGMVKAFTDIPERLPGRRTPGMRLALMAGFRQTASTPLAGSETRIIRFEYGGDHG